MNDDYIVWPPGELPEWLRDNRNEINELEISLSYGWSWGCRGGLWKTHSYRMNRFAYERLKPQEHAESPWVRYEERKPTEADADAHGKVLWRYALKSGLSNVAAFVWNDTDWCEYDNVQWMRIPDPLPPKSK